MGRSKGEGRKNRYEFRRKTNRTSPHLIAQRSGAAFSYITTCKSTSRVLSLANYKMGNSDLEFTFIFIKAMLQIKSMSFAARLLGFESRWSLTCSVTLGKLLNIAVSASGK